MPADADLISVAEYPCHYCGKVLSTVWSRQLHEKQHTGDQDHRCTICDRSFGNAYRLRRHMRSHTDERPFRCDCGADFAIEASYQRHVRSHRDEDQRPHPCPLCNKRFLEPYKLKKHMRVHVKHTFNISP